MEGSLSPTRIDFIGSTLNSEKGAAARRLKNRDAFNLFKEQLVGLLNPSLSNSDISNFKSNELDSQLEAQGVPPLVLPGARAPVRRITDTRKVIRLQRKFNQPVRVVREEPKVREASTQAENSFKAYVETTIS